MVSLVGGDAGAGERRRVDQIDPVRHPDDERLCEVLDDRGRDRLRRRPWARPLLLTAGHRSLLRPVLASIPEARRTDIGLSTASMRSITDSGPGVGYE